MSFSIAKTGLRTAKSASTAGRSLIFARTKVTLPDLDYDFGALEPYISGQINELHYTKHHQTYVNGFNTATEQIQEAKAAGDIVKEIQLGQAIRFHGGGFVNHNLWWKGLAPPSQGGGEPPVEGSPLDKAIKAQYKSLDNLIGLVNGKLAGIQGSGWAWLVKNKENNSLDVITKPNQDPVDGPYVPIVGIDAWEHAYYLQYKNVKADYFKAIWKVINWKEAERRYGA